MRGTGRIPNLILCRGCCCSPILKLASQSEKGDVVDNDKFTGYESVKKVEESDMPRQARLDGAGTLHHVILRGIKKRQLFDDDLDGRNQDEDLRLDFIDQSRSYFVVTHERILGTDDFVESVLGESERRAKRLSSFRRQEKEVEKFILGRCKREGISILELQGGVGVERFRGFDRN